MSINDKSVGKRNNRLAVFRVDLSKIMLYDLQGYISLVLFG